MVTLFKVPQPSLLQPQKYQVLPVSVPPPPVQLKNSLPPPPVQLKNSLPPPPVQLKNSLPLQQQLQRVLCQKSQPSYLECWDLVMILTAMLLIPLPEAVYSTS